MSRQTGRGTDVQTGSSMDGESGWTDRQAEGPESVTNRQTGKAGGVSRTDREARARKRDGQTDRRKAGEHNRQTQNNLANRMKKKKTRQEGGEENITGKRRKKEKRNFNRYAKIYMYIYQMNILSFSGNYFHSI